ncbi:MAG TPA: acetate--CoA ligase, partial [Acidimicrobiales bacterium]|nr:acetate--CoA ligase [Acidimicrobiales bacterium]
MAPEPTIEDYLKEERAFPPPSDFAANALVSDRSMYEEAEADFEAFWARQARELLTWSKDFTQVLEWDLPFARWFADGELNVSYNCLDRHVEAGRGDKVAFHWEGEPGDTRTITYADLLAEVQRFSNVLKRLGVEKGDRVAIYMPMIPELPVAMLSCARLGAAHSVVFGGFSPDSLIDRINDAEAKVVVTADGGWRRGSASGLKVNVDAALGSTPSVESVVVVRRTEQDVEWVDGRDHWYHDLMAEADAECPAEPMEAEQLLYLLYTSGTTAKPKGIMHTTGGYLTQVAFSHKYVFDLHPDTDVYWCAADIGWVTGHSYIVYGPLTNGATSVMYEGTPDHPHKARLWEIVETYGVTQLYTAPTAIRTFMKWGPDEPASKDLSSLRLLGTVGEPINPEAWMWYHEHIGGGRCPIVDTWWQTETGGHMITPLPGVVTTKPGSATFPLPGVGAEVVDEAGNKVEQGGGYLTLTHPWPSMLRGIWGDPDRYRETYWSRFEGRYFAGDGAKVDEDGYLWLLGRVDDVMNVSGHRISTTEVESALVDHPAVAEAAVVGTKDDTTGQAIVGYVI